MVEGGAGTVLHSVAGANHGADVAPAPTQLCREGGFIEEIHEVLVVIGLSRISVQPGGVSLACYPCYEHNSWPD